MRVADINKDVKVQPDGIAIKDIDPKESLKPLEPLNGSTPVSKASKVGETNPIIANPSLNSATPVHSLPKIENANLEKPATPKPNPPFGSNQAPSKAEPPIRIAICTLYKPIPRTPPRTPATPEPRSAIVILPGQKPHSGFCVISPCL